MLFVYQLANEFNLCDGHKALTSCQKEVHDSRMHDGQWSRSIGSELVLRLTDDLASWDERARTSFAGMHDS